MHTFSIIIPTHNRPTQLRRAVTSALAAAGSTGEVVVVDDASEIPAHQVLSDFHGSQLKVIRNKTPLAGGGSPSRNNGVKAATGAVLFFLDDDDELAPDYCSEVIRTALVEGATFGFSAREFILVSDQRIEQSSTEKRELKNGTIPTAVRFKAKTFPFSAGFWMLRETYKAVGPMEEQMRTNSDTEYCCRLYASGRAGWYSKAPGVRIYDDNARPTSEVDSVTRRTKSKDRAAAFRLLIEKNSEYLSRDPSAGAFVFGRLMKHSFREGNLSTAVTSGLRAGVYSLRSRGRFGG